MDALGFLLLAIAALGVGPLLAGVLTRRPHLHQGLDGFVLVMVGGLCVLELLPHAWEGLGAGALGLAAVGFVLPTLAERRLHHHTRGETGGFVLLAALGLLVHSALDGAALAAGGHAAELAGAGHEHALHAGHDHGLPAAGDPLLPVALAILLHNLPVGLVIWWSVQPTLGRRLALGLLAAMAGATAFGFGLSASLAAVSEGWPVAVLNALLAGALLHVVLDHAPPHASTAVRHPLASAAGALAGGGLLLRLVEAPAPFRGAGNALVELLHESSLAVLIGLGGAGLLSLVPRATLTRLMTGRTALTSALRGVVFGLPLPVCSCGVVPLYRGLMRQGVPPAAAAAFLIATPELGVDSLVVSVPLLGVELAITRLACALVVALSVGLVVGWVAPPPAPQGGEAEEAAEARPWRQRLTGAARYGFVESVDDLGPWILAGLLVAAFLAPTLAPGAFTGIPPAAQVPLLAAAASPVYVCATAATPVAAVLLAKGLAPGAAIAFLLTAPATNVTTFGAIRAAHDRRVTWIALGTILLATVAVGLIVNLLPLAPAPLLAGGAAAAHEAGPIARGATALFLLLLVLSLARQGPRGFLARLGLGARPCPAHPLPAEDDDHAGHDHAGHDHAGHDHAGHAAAPRPLPTSACCEGSSACADARPRVDPAARCE